MWVMVWLIYLYLMCFRLSIFLLWILILLKTLAGKMPKFMTYLALILFCWACDSFLVGGITTLWTPVVVCLRVAACLKLVGSGCPWSSDLDEGHFCIMVYCYPVWVWHETFSFCIYVEVVLSSGDAVNWFGPAWGSPDTCFICLAMAFELSNFLANWCTPLAGNLSRLMLPSLMVLDTKSSSFRKNQNMSLCSILAVSGGYLAKFTCACMALYHSSMLWPPLAETCQ